MYRDFRRENSNIMTVTLTDDTVFGSLKIGPDAKIFFRVFFYAVSFVVDLFLQKTSDLRVDQKSVKYY